MCKQMTLLQTNFQLSDSRDLKLNCSKTLQEHCLNINAKLNDRYCTKSY